MGLTAGFSNAVVANSLYFFVDDDEDAMMIMMMLVVSIVSVLTEVMSKNLTGGWRVLS